MSFSDAHNAINQLIQQMNQVMRYQTEAIELLAAAALCGGHILIEDVPGTGKTTLAKTFSKSVDLGFQRIQFTPDLLPSDILGVSVYNPDKRTFDLHKGPIFTNVLLADEINRASPRTQSALLEAMAEKQVSLERKIHILDDFFLVIATQNPIESQGTYPLPEAQMDRFAVRFSLGYIPADEEVELLSQQMITHPLESLSACITAKAMAETRKEVAKVRVSPKLTRYIVDLVHATRELESIQLGASSRASITWLKLSQSLALIKGQEFVTPDHIQALAVPVLAHRLTLNADAVYAGLSSEQIIADIMQQIPVPS